MHDHDEKRERDRDAAVLHLDERPRDLPSPHDLASPREALALQRLVGNAATSRLITGRAGAGGATVQRATAGEAMDLDESDYEDDGFLAAVDSLEQQKYDEIVQGVYRELAGRSDWQVNWTADRPGRRKRFTARKLDASGRTPAVRPHAMEGQERSLTWLAGVVKGFLEAGGKNPVEVQCAVHGGEFLIACNDVAANTALGQAFARQGNDLRGYLKALARGFGSELRRGGAPTRPSDDPATRSAEHARLTAHSAKAESALGDEGEQYGDVLTAIATKVRVPDDATPEVHAEQRIMTLTGGVPPTMIGGTRRPCLTCYLGLHPEGTTATRPGHLYSVELMKNVDVFRETAESVLRNLFGKMERAGVTATYRTAVPGHHGPHGGTERYGSESERE
ncbi:hypothetical protein [Saccharothrix syringae]|uniref:Uncharacterized protein n=1 Tax=Saccharothrix syringae TaxID=103733 RepID=A0A5Q0GYV1_SACSY|nr:hypothetical protein [Saccharothrix syringae]QFZ18704.1 hypothetical protein EKG83_15655 [Saccharothrix syringae]